MMLLTSMMIILVEMMLLLLLHSIWPLDAIIGSGDGSGRSFKEFHHFSIRRIPTLLLFLLLLQVLCLKCRLLLLLLWRTGNSSRLKIGEARLRGIRPSIHMRRGTGQNKSAWLMMWQLLQLRLMRRRLRYCGRGL
jgi:hypothetical protein